MSLKSMEDVLYHGLKDLLSAEKQFRDALPKLADAAEDAELKEAYTTHQTETMQQIARLEKCFEILDRAARSEKCMAADGLTREGAEAIEEDGEAPAKDVVLAAAGRKVEHYEIVSYSDAVAWASQLGQDTIAAYLNETLAEEREADEKLHRIGQRLAKAG